MDKEIKIISLCENCIKMFEETNNLVCPFCNSNRIISLTAEGLKEYIWEERFQAIQDSIKWRTD